MRLTIKLLIGLHIQAIYRWWWWLFYPLSLSSSWEIQLSQMSEKMERHFVGKNILKCFKILCVFPQTLGFFDIFKLLQLALATLNDQRHLRIATTCLQRPPFWSSNFSFYKLPLNNNHLSTTATNSGFLGWSLCTGLLS